MFVFCCCCSVQFKGFLGCNNTAKVLNFKKRNKKSKFIPGIIEYSLLAEHVEEKIQYFGGKRGKRVWPFCFCDSAE